MTMTKDQLEQMYRNNTNVECCRKLGVSKVTFISYLRKAGIQLKGKGGGFASSKLTVINNG